MKEGRNFRTAGDYHKSPTICAAFVDGAEWADKHPINVWHNVSEEPKIGSNIVAIDENRQWWDIQPYNGNYDWHGLDGWRSCIRTYNIQKWAYINDLLPKKIGD